MGDHRLRGPERIVRRWDDVFDALAADPRRRVVDALLDVPRGEFVTLPDAASDPGAPTDDDRLQIELCHQHLPLLTDGGYVEWEQSPLRARRGPRFEELAVVLESLYENASAVPDGLVRDYRLLEQHR